MSDREIDRVRALLAARPRPTDLTERRARLDAIGAADPLPSDIHCQSVKVGGVDCEWSSAPGSDAMRVLIFFHGGGYCSGSIASHRGMVSAAGRAAGIRTLAVGYRLAPENPFPAAIDDAVAVYEALLSQGIAAERIAVGGDSAGGGLTLALMLRMRETSRPLPGCGWLVSPWVDLSMTGATLTTKAAVDPLISRTYLEELAAAYLSGADALQPLVSPLYADLTRLPPLLIQVGSAETLLDDAVRLAGRAAECDVPVTLQVWPHMIHAWHLWAPQLAAGRDALSSAGTFIRAHIA